MTTDGSDDMWLMGKMMYLENDFNSWMWILLFLCGFMLIFLAIYHKQKLNLKCFVEVGSRKRICTSLSCVRCTYSAFSTKKLLKKWNEIVRALQPDKKLHQRINNAILRKHSCKTSEQQAPTIFYLENVSTKVWYTAEDYSKEAAILKRNFDDIVSEFYNISQNLDIGWVSNTVPSGGWYLFSLVNQGVTIEENCHSCPKTMNLIDKLPSLMSDCVFGNIMFSVLLPGTKISGHCGPTNVRIRCHVPVVIPDGYFIKVAGEQRTWQKDKVMIFDDSFYHEVYHNGNSLESRVVLMIDFWHPDLNYEEKEIIKTLFSP